jgi:hypothetical protein
MLRLMTDVVLSQSGCEGKCLLILTQWIWKHQMTTKLLKFLPELTLRYVPEDSKIHYKNLCVLTLINFNLDMFVAVNIFMCSLFIDAVNYWASAALVMENWMSAISGKALAFDNWSRIWDSEERASWFILIMKAKEMHYFSNLFDKVIYMFRTGSLSETCIVLYPINPRDSASRCFSL